MQLRFLHIGIWRSLCISCFVFLLFVSCEEKKNTEVPQEISMEQIVKRPQWVIERIDSLLLLPENTGQKEQMRLHLQRAEAMVEILDNRLVIDSLHPIAVWFSTNGTMEEQVRIYFCMGVAHYLQLEKEESVRWFKRAYDVADVSNSDVTAYLNRIQFFTDADAGRWLEEVLRVKLKAQQEATQMRNQWFMGTIIVLSVLLVLAIVAVLHLLRLQRLAQRATQLASEKELLEKRWHQRSQAVMNVSDTFTIFKDAAENGWTIDDTRVWEGLFNTVDESYPSFAFAMREKEKALSQSDIQLCYLLRLGLKQADIARLWKQSRATISRRCKQVEQILGVSPDVL